MFIIATYKPPTYGDYEYPDAAIVFGWCVALAPILPVPVLAVLEIRKAPGDTIAKVIQKVIIIYSIHKITNILVHF